MGARHSTASNQSLPLTFALGIGANTAVFSVMNAVVLRLLPVSNPHELVFLHSSSARPSRTSAVLRPRDVLRPDGGAAGGHRAVRDAELSISRRTSEIGVRIALGAGRGQVLWMIVRESLVVAVVGLAIGVPLAIMGSRWLASTLFGLTPGDPISFAVALAAVTLVTIGASLVPARRAATLDPMRALRSE